MKRIGLDLGSTTVKAVVLDEAGTLLHVVYRRHMSKIAEMSAALLDEIAEMYPDETMSLTLSGSAGMGMAEDLKYSFAQEVWATRTAVRTYLPETSVVIELGGEDAKILFLGDGMEVRMNGSCAGGTGAFIDQMATLLNLSPDDMDTLAKAHEKIYTIASRCGVFAKSDIQPLLNQGARKEDICAGIFYAVVNQTVGGLAQGRDIEGSVLYLGGPLTFFSSLREAFDDVLGVTGTLPDHSLYFVALGAALTAGGTEITPREAADALRHYSSSSTYISCPPLFRDVAEYEAFRTAHAGDSDNIRELTAPADVMYLGVDAGSTTIKAVLTDADGNLFRPFYRSNSGNPVPLIREYLSDLYRDYPGLHIASAAVTGYGEDVIRHAFSLDHGLVETMAHYTAARRFCPDVDFIIDIGGQDIKCFRIRGGAIDSLFLNEACSSGCGSFLQSFAQVLGYDMEEFSRLALYAPTPVDLGSRCTVFMNSSVKQAQKDGATLADIAAGLSVSVVKNALYKVIRCTGPDDLGHHIVVQGGTFLNDAVLRAFECELGFSVMRPQIAGLMGAYGAALYAAAHAPEDGQSTILDATALATFEHTVKAVTCHGCQNHCRLTVNNFGARGTYISGNRCERPVTHADPAPKLNLYAYKQSLIEAYRTTPRIEGRKTIGIPTGLNMYELLPFWHTLLTTLGFNVAVSPASTHALYLRGQHTIPSDTICYPAKLLHGHVEALLEEGVDAVFYPSMSYNVDEKLGNNHYNCPVVAYYPKVIGANVRAMAEVDYISDFIGIHSKKEFPAHFHKILVKHGYDVTLKDVKRAATAAYEAYEHYMADVRAKAQEYLTLAHERHLPVIVLAGRPYHVDPEINHGIDRLIADLGAVVITEDSVSHLVTPPKTKVLNQWTYHARLYAAAKFVTECRDLNISLVQLVSFGCGVDAITTDETRDLLESCGKLYTQIKIDEITNLGAVKIRLRSLFAILGI